MPGGIGFFGLAKVEVVAATIYEWYGFRLSDNSAAAQQSAVQRDCPFTFGVCTKRTGVCSVIPARSSDRVIVCPKRLYFDNYDFLTYIAADAFDDIAVNLGPHGRPLLVSASEAAGVAYQTGVSQVGVFGGEWGREVRLPSMTDTGSRGGYSVDFTLIVVDPSGELIRIAPVEVQSIDTTGNLSDSIDGAKFGGRSIVPSEGAGLNWENVNKRIIPQLIQKGLMLQAESLCRSGIYFVAPEPVFQKLMARLGGVHRFRRIPKQPGSLTFVRYEYDDSAKVEEGVAMPLRHLSDLRISTSDFSMAFITPENLPAPDSYANAIRRRLRQNVR